MTLFNFRVHLAHVKGLDVGAAVDGALCGIFFAFFAVVNDVGGGNQVEDDKGRDPHGNARVGGESHKPLGHGCR